MYKIFVDLEMHPIPHSNQDERQICTQEIIEIGAVKLNEQNDEVSSFCEFVRPAYVTKIYSRFQKLTGITTADVAEADPITFRRAEIMKENYDDMHVLPMDEYVAWQELNA